MSGSIVVEATSLETLTIDVVTPPPVVVSVEVIDYGGPPIGYTQLPSELQQLAIPFWFTGPVAADAMVNIPMGFSLSIDRLLAGTITYAKARPTAPASFILNKIAGGIVSQLGVITLTPANSYSHALSGNGGSLLIGDVLQIIAPAIADATLADIGITVMAKRT